MIPHHMRYAYERYISSKEWENKRDYLIEKTYSTEYPELSEHRGNYRCQKCLWFFQKNQLEVHHLHYERLGNEREEDLLVVCERCHKKLDKIRAREGRQRSDDALDNARFYGWASAKYGEDWESWCDIERLAEEFDEWAERKDEEEYY